VSLAELRLVHTIELEPGTEPGRSVESADGLVHVALRGSGEVITIDAVNGTVRDRTAVCKAPRGIAFEQATQQLHVACLEGKLVSLNAFDLDVERTLSLDADLRDVVVRGSELWVTRFKSAEVLRVDAKGVVGSRIAQPHRLGALTQPVPEDEQNQFGPVATREVSLQAGVAWRTIPAPGGGVMMVHQQAVVDEIEIHEPSPQGGSAYGGSADFGFDCTNAIVKNTISSIAANGTSVATTIMGPPMPVDVALSADHQLIAVAHAGPADLAAPRPKVVFRDEHSSSESPTSPPQAFAVSIFSTGIGEGCAFPEAALFDVPVVALTFSPKGPLVVQMREPAMLVIVTDPPWGLAQTISLGGDTRKDTGHELFHRDSGGGIACGSCHPEAAEDGHVWSFADTGLRRTQALHVGLRDTAPFHWNGDLPDVGALMSEVFVGRMGGVKQTPQRLSSLSEWIISIEPPPPIRDQTDEAVARGKALFESAAVGCTACHGGEKLTNNETVAISTVISSRLQVPSLQPRRARYLKRGRDSTPSCSTPFRGPKLVW